MSPISIHILLPRNDPSLGQLFHRFPAQVWTLVKSIIFGFALILALVAVLFGIIMSVWLIFSFAPTLLNWLISMSWKEVMERWREKFESLKRTERFNRMWGWLRFRSAGAEDGAVDVEELRHLDSLDCEGREGSVGGETLFEGEEDEVGMAK